MAIEYYPTRRQALPINWRGAFSQALIYAIDDMVLFNGNVYLATGPNLNFSQGYTPDSALSDWELFTSKGDVGPLPEFLTDLQVEVSALATTSGTATVSFTANGFRTQGPITGNIIYAGSDYTIGNTVSLRITGGASTYSVSFPAGWKFVSSKPVNIPAGKTSILSLTSFGTSESDVVAAWVSEA